MRPIAADSRHKVTIMKVLNTTPELRRIFRLWAKAAETVAKRLPVANSYRAQIEIASRKLDQLSKASDTIVVSEGGATLDQVEVIADICSKMPHAQMKPQVLLVRQWLAEASGSNGHNERTEQ